MSEVLSEDAIAELFAAAEDGALPQAPRPQQRAPVVRKIDFSRPTLLSLPEQRHFERAHVTFCRDVSEHLSREFETGIELEVIGSAQLSWQGALEDTPKPSVLAVAECAPGEAMVMCVEQAMVLRMIDRLLGGSYGAPVAPRDLTALDAVVARDIFQGLLGALSLVWQELLGFNLTLLEFELANTSLEYLSPFEATLELTIEVRDPAGSSTMLLLVPHSVIKASGKNLDSAGGGEAEHAPDAGEAHRLSRSVGSASVEVRAELGSAELTLGDVTELTPGQIVPLGAAGLVHVTVDGHAIHAATPGLRGARRAVQIVPKEVSP